MKHFVRLLAVIMLLSIGRFAFAGSEVTTETNRSTSVAASDDKVPLDVFDFQTSYTFESDINARNDRVIGSQDEWVLNFEYGHRFHLTGNFYLHLGVAYDRFDFGDQLQRLPAHMQSLAGVVSIEYMQGENVGALLEVRPGYYFENDMNSASFDAPITAFRFWVIQPDKFYIGIGANAGFLRGRWPVIPIGGVVYIFNKEWRIMGVLPEPRVIYSPNDRLEIWAGGQLLGGSFRMDKDYSEHGKLAGAEMDYTEYRGGAGLAYDITRNITLDVGAGYSFERNLNFNRANIKYNSDGAPYARAMISAKF